MQATASVPVAPAYIASELNDDDLQKAVEQAADRLRRIYEAGDHARFHTAAMEVVALTDEKVMRFMATRGGLL